MILERLLVQVKKQHLIGCGFRLGIELMVKMLLLLRGKDFLFLFPPSVALASEFLSLITPLSAQESSPISKIIGRAPMVHFYHLGIIDQYVEKANCLSKVFFSGLLFLEGNDLFNRFRRKFPMLWGNRLLGHIDVWY